jgi:acyl dehydratase
VTAAGDLIPERRILVRAESMPVWSAALRDPNPIHLDPEAARAAGLGDRVINQGPANIGYLVNALSDAFPGRDIVRMDFRFLDNVYAGDVAVARGTVVAVSEGAIECALELSVEGRAVLTGTATLRR